MRKMLTGSQRMLLSSTTMDSTNGSRRITRRRSSPWCLVLLIVVVVSSCFGGVRADLVEDASSWLFGGAGDKRGSRQLNPPPSYHVCHGAAEQLLYHAVHIAALHLEIDVSSDEANRNHNPLLEASRRRRLQQADEEELEEDDEDEDEEEENEEEETEEETDEEETEEEDDENEVDDQEDEDDTSEAEAETGIDETNSNSTTTDSSSSLRKSSRRRRRPLIRIPNVFVVDTRDSIVPTLNNSIPLLRVIDTKAWMRSLRQKLKIRTTLDRPTSRRTIRHGRAYYASYHGWNHTNATTTTTSSTPTTTCPPIQDLLDRVAAAGGGQLVYDILNLLEPGGVAAQWSDFILKELPDGHHLNGLCWHAVEDTEGAIHKPHNLLNYRGWTPHRFGYARVEGVLPNNDLHMTTHEQLWNSSRRTRPKSVPTGEEFWSLVDWWVCREMRYFVGYAPSWWSTLQLASRDLSTSFWYPAGSAPRLWNTPQHVLWDVPVVLTYTETSSPLVQYAFQATIKSLRHQLPHAQIHVLYHGQDDGGQGDGVLQKWLTKDMGVNLLEHEPTWKAKLDQLHAQDSDDNDEQQEDTLDTNSTLSNSTFSHSDNLLRSLRTRPEHVTAGDHFAAWQRIDAPIYIDFEYCLFVDASRVTLFQQPLNALSLDLPTGLALASEAGVMLYNVPYLRQTYRPFMKHVMKGNFASSATMYQEYYQQHVSSLPPNYGWQPVLPPSENAPILQFANGQHPAHFVQSMLLQPHAHSSRCDQELDESASNGVCHSLRLFAQHLPNVRGYCEASFPGNGKSGHVRFCQALFQNLVKDSCSNLPKLIQTTLDSLPFHVSLPRKDIAQRFGFWVEPLKAPEMPAPPGHLLVSGLATTLVGGMLIFYLVVRAFRGRRRHRRLLLAATFAWLLLCFVFMPLIWSASL